MGWDSEPWDQSLTALLTTKSSVWGKRILNLNLEIFQTCSRHFWKKKTPPDSFLIIFSFAFITDTPANKCLLSGRSVTLIQGCNLGTALSTSLAAYSRYCLLLHSRKTGSEDKEEAEEVGARKDRHERREKPQRTEEWGRATGKRRESLNRFCGRKRGMNIPILPCSLETAASSFGGQHCLCLFPAWLFAWCIPQLYIQWWEKDDVLAGWQWGLRGAEVGTVGLIQCKDQRPCCFTTN